MSKRFNALKNNENIFKKESVRKKKPSIRSVDSGSSPFKVPKKAKQLPAPEIFQTVTHIVDKPKEFKLEDAAFPDLSTAVSAPKTKPSNTKLNFGNTASKSCLTNSKVNMEPITRAKLGVHGFESASSRKLSKMTAAVIRELDEQESKAHFMLWYKNWQDDRNMRIEQGEKFYEPYDLEDIDDLSDSDLSDDYEMEETEYWGSSRYKQAYEN